MDLEEFLALGDVNDIQEEVLVSKRLGKFTVKAMSADEYGEYIKRSRGKINKDGTNFDSTKFNLLVIVGQTIKPDFSNSELLEKAGCSTATELVKRKLLAGEIQELSNQICKISGFDSDINEDIEEAKN